MLRKHDITTRPYNKNDAHDLSLIYYNTIHNINSKDYTPGQINAWAPTSSLEIKDWQKKWERIPPIIALINDQIVGFSEFEPNGHIDCFYVHHLFQGRGIGNFLMIKIEEKAHSNNITKIYAEVSISAKPFFIRKGFKVIKQQIVTIRNQELQNFIMEKYI